MLGKKTGLKEDKGKRSAAGMKYIRDSGLRRLEGGKVKVHVMGVPSIMTKGFK